MTDPILIGVAVTLGALLFAVRVVSLSGALSGAFLVYLLGTFAGWPAVFATGFLVVGGHGASRYRRDAKVRLGVAQEHGGTRGGIHAVANVLPAVLWALVIGPLPALGALAAAFGDTVSSELGMLSKGSPRKLLFGPSMPVGSDGAMSPFGTLAGALASFLIALFAWPLGAKAVVLVALAGVFGGFVDSLLGLFVEPHIEKRIKNHVVNFLASIAGGGFVLLGGL